MVPGAYPLRLEGTVELMSSWVLALYAQGFLPRGPGPTGRMSSTTLGIGNRHRLKTRAWTRPPLSPMLLPGRSIDPVVAGKNGGKSTICSFRSYFVWVNLTLGPEV